MNHSATASPQQQAAADAIARGWHIFPVQTSAKTPACARGVLEATAEPGGITRHWTDHPTHNVGLACGPSGLVVIDLDLPKDGFAFDEEYLIDNASQSAQGCAYVTGINDGLDAFAALCDKHRQPFPWTYTVVTPRGGWHLYYGLAPGLGIRNSTGKVAPLVDVRADGGYVLAAGSVVDGKPYTALHSTQAIEPLPMWLIRLLSAETQTVRGTAPPPRPVPAEHAADTVAQACQRISHAPEGERHATLAAVTASLARRGLLDGPAADQVRAAARQAGRTAREADQAIASAVEKFGAFGGAAWR